MRQLFSILLLFLTLITVTGCENKDPVTLAYVGPTSGRNSDLGIGGRNGFILAIEQKNQTGGVHGQSVTYQIKDDEQNATLAVKIFEELTKNPDIDVIIGPMTSSIAMSVIDIVKKANKVTISPTVTTPALSNIDDNFFRVLATNDMHAKASAEFLFTQKNIQNIAITLDIGNAAYSKSWVSNLTERFSELGGIVTATVEFKSDNTLEVGQITDRLTKDNPQAIIIVGNSIDTALIIQKIRQLSGPDQIILTSEWSGTERLIELAGRHVEGVYIPQYIDRNSKATDFLAFKAAYEQRFNSSPGFAAISAFNAANTALKAIEQKSDHETTKETLLRIRNFGGIQSPVQFTEFGDNSGTAYMVRVEDGQFEVQ